MKKIIISLIFALTLITFYGVNNVEAKYVSGYMRSNGTYVSGYFRSSPNALRYDNRSYRGGSLFNKSYTSPTRNYSPSWYSPSYNWFNY